MTCMNHCIPCYIISTPATFPAHHNLLFLTMLTTPDDLYEPLHSWLHNIHTSYIPSPSYPPIPHHPNIRWHTPHTVAHSALSQTAPLCNHSRYTHFLGTSFSDSSSYAAFQHHFSHSYTQQLAVLIQALSIDVLFITAARTRSRYFFFRYRYCTTVHPIA